MGNSDDWCTQNCPPQDCPPRGQLWGSPKWFSENFEIFKKIEIFGKCWDFWKFLIFLENVWDFRKILIKCLKGYKSLGSLCNVKIKMSLTQSVSESVTRSPIELFWTAKNDRECHTVSSRANNSCKLWHGTNISWMLLTIDFCDIFLSPDFVPPVLTAPAAGCYLRQGRSRRKPEWVRKATLFVQTCDLPNIDTDSNTYPLSGSNATFCPIHRSDHHHTDTDT